jgi:phosphate transport system substrate-binding protein
MKLAPILAGAIAFALAASSAVAADIRLAGAGATFPAPLYQRWIADFQKANSSIKLDYRSIGSGGGIKAITDKTVAFGASDAPLSKREIEALGGPDAIVQIPTAAGGVVPAFNLAGITEVNFTGEILADIYLGKVTKWNDPRLVAINPNAKLPNLAITPAWRTDGSGTTFVFTNFLGTQSEAFTTGVGLGKQVKWPVGQGGKGNEGVAAIVQQTAGALGYIEQNYAVANSIAFGTVQNKEGKFVKASLDSIASAGAGAADELKGTVLAADLWNRPGAQTYPIAAFTYVIVYKDLANLATVEEAEALVRYLDWTINKGDAIARDMHYAPLAEPVKAKVNAALMALTFKGSTLNPGK